VRKNIKFQSIKIYYPKKLYSTALWIKYKKRLLLFFLQKSFKSLKLIKTYSKDTIDSIQKTAKGKVSLLDSILVFQTSFYKHYFLTKELWDPSPYVFDKLQRNFLFIDAASKPEIYYLLVTPIIKEGKGGNSFAYTAAFPFLKSQLAGLKDLIRASDLFVSPEAKNCAIYKIDQVFGYDLIKNRVIKRDLKDSKDFENETFVN